MIARVLREAPRENVRPVAGKTQPRKVAEVLRFMPVELEQRVRNHIGRRE